jgi:hypothetical protein
MNRPKNQAESEIESHSQGVAENVWLAEVGMINSADTSYDIKLINEWNSLGSETYVMDFLVRAESRTVHAMAKACIKFFAKETMDDWVARRSIIEEAGISVPKLYSVQKATLIEEYIPYSFKEAHSRADRSEQEHLAEQFKCTFSTLLDLGFNPISLHDIRSRGDDAVIIDFGFDLGGPSENIRPIDDSEKNKIIETQYRKIIP